MVMILVDIIMCLGMRSLVYKGKKFCYRLENSEIVAYIIHIACK